MTTTDDRLIDEHMTHALWSISGRALWELEKVARLFTAPLHSQPIVCSFRLYLQQLGWNLK